MKVSELKEILLTLPDDMEVILQKDAEGNGYSPLCGGDPNAVYIPETAYSGDVYSTDWDADDACMTHKQWNETLAKPRALILYPIN